MRFRVSMKNVSKHTIPPIRRIPKFIPHSSYQIRPVSYHRPIQEALEVHQV